MKSEDCEKFHKWYLELVDLALEEDVPCLVSDDPGDHRESFEDGKTPDAELDWLIETAL